MLEVVVRAAICTQLLALVVQLCLWTLRVRHPARMIICSPVGPATSRCPNIHIPITIFF